jgi:hypothetical protein
MAKMLWEQIDAKPAAVCSAEEYERAMEERLRKGLY